MMAWASAGEVSGPKFIVPRQRRLTLRPERPRGGYSMRPSLSRRRSVTVGGNPLAGAAGRRAVAAGGAPADVHERLAAGGRSAQTGRGGPAPGGQPRPPPG